MHCTPTLTLVARKRHHCTNCGELINPGETYLRWVTFDDSAFTNKMHPECLAALRKEAICGSFEYEAYQGERPKT